MTEPLATMYYVHDPMCSWCWAYRPRMLEVREALENTWSGRVAWRNVLGGLAPDSDQPMPPEQQREIRSHWQKIQQITETRFNFDFWTDCEPRRDTYKACRAVIAADAQCSGDAMVEAIQKAYYLRAMNPSDYEVLVQLAEELGLRKARFEHDLLSSDTEQALYQDLDLRSQLGVRSFPSLVLAHGDNLSMIDHDYHKVEPTLARIDTCLALMRVSGPAGV